MIRQVQLKRAISLPKCAYTLTLLLGLYVLLIQLFAKIDSEDPYLTRILTGRPRTIGHLSWLVWLVIFADTTMKLLAIGVKCIVLILSRGCLFKRVSRPPIGFNNTSRDAYFPWLSWYQKFNANLLVVNLFPSFYPSTTSSIRPFLKVIWVKDLFYKAIILILSLGYLLLFTFIGFKLFILYGMLAELKAVSSLLLRTPNFNHLIESNTENCDLTVKVYSEHNMQYRG